MAWNRPSFGPSWSSTRPSSTRKVLWRRAQWGQIFLVRQRWQWYFLKAEFPFKNYEPEFRVVYFLCERIPDSQPLLMNQILDQLLLQRTFQQNGHLSGAGVKAADTILKKHPEHGETLCMKAREWLGPPVDLLDVGWHPFFWHGTEHPNGWHHNLIIISDQHGHSGGLVMSCEPFISFKWYYERWIQGFQFRKLLSGFSL